jgi:hypothetical protein
MLSPNNEPAQLMPSFDPCVEKCLGVSNLSFVMAVDCDGNVTLHPAPKTHASIVREEDPAPANATILKNLPGAMLVFQVNPTCIRKTLGNTTYHFHQP